ncbi:MAG: hypothetical protein ACE5HO_15305 [bacterium]
MPDPVLSSQSMWPVKRWPLNPSKTVKPTIQEDGKRHVYRALVESYRTERGPRIRYDLLLCDLTSAYFEAGSRSNPKANRIKFTDGIMPTKKVNWENR